MKYKLIALDLDGTLKNSNNEITTKTKEALIKAQEAGIKIVLSSGRPTPGLRHDAEALELTKYGGFLLSYNGARVSSIDGTNIYSKELNKEAAKGIIKIAKEHHLAINTYTNDELLSEEASKYVALEANLVDLPIKIVKPIEDHLPSPLFKLLLSEEPDYLATTLPAFKEAYPDLSIYRSSPFFIECMDQGINKAEGLAKLCEYIGITREELIAFGDGYNDAPMIEFAGCGVAMGNAVDEVKAVADYVTKSNDEDGIAEALAKLID